MADIIDQTSHKFGNLRTLENSGGSLDERKQIMKELKVFINRLTCRLNWPSSRLFLHLSISQIQKNASSQVRFNSANFRGNLRVRCVPEHWRKGYSRIWEELCHPEFLLQWITVSCNSWPFRGILPESSKKNSVLGLYLLYLLSQNKISEFHVELQSIPSSDHSNIYINVPVSLEQYFVDGNYAKVLATKNVPLDAYNFFISKFIDTVRTEIARSVEVSYNQLTLQDAWEIFMLENVDELKQFVERESGMDAEDRTISWIIQDNYLTFVTVNVEKEAVPAKKMMYQVLEYANELQRIV